MTHFRIFAALGAGLFALSACGLAERIGAGAGISTPAGQAQTSAGGTLSAPTPARDATLSPATAAPPPSPAARTAEALDTTTAEQRAAATAKPTVPSTSLGTTVVSLGSPTEPGLWLKTPLVDTETEGRVTNTQNGKSAVVTLIPIEGANTAGSRMSLAALRLIEASLTDLTKVEVALNG
jgi:hypothetical protein